MTERSTLTLEIVNVYVTLVHNTILLKRKLNLLSFQEFRGFGPEIFRHLDLFSFQQFHEIVNLKSDRMIY